MSMSGGHKVDVGGVGRLSTSLLVETPGAVDNIALPLPCIIVNTNRRAKNGVGLGT